ncbi:hypothetical protein [Staphylococcus massiliensis]|uniref:Phage protein n=1 Tax=Staphylococcus massiliensis S46 TaxID=1229783 RepID=K9B695_9STAP|nr:hypothetical protein [Staphylococcus massiliensis]EKU50332.1 hypothetical protein C273_01780 [Staphylococcus massiliensis S46]
MVKIKREKVREHKELLKDMVDGGKYHITDINRGNDDAMYPVFTVSFQLLDRVKSINDEGFVVEVEEEITEDTKIPVLLERCQEEYYSGHEWFEHTNTSIKKEKEQGSKAFYMLDDDMSMTLLWKDGEMVE